MSHSSPVCTAIMIVAPAAVLALMLVVLSIAASSGGSGPSAFGATLGGSHSGACRIAFVRHAARGGICG